MAGKYDYLKKSTLATMCSDFKERISHSHNISVWGYKDKCLAILNGGTPYFIEFLHDGNICVGIPGMGDWHALSDFLKDQTCVYFHNYITTPDAFLEMYKCSPAAYRIKNSIANGEKTIMESLHYAVTKERYRSANVKYNIESNDSSDTITIKMKFIRG